MLMINNNDTPRSLWKWVLGGLFWTALLIAIIIIYGNVVLGRAVSFEEMVNSGDLKKDQYAYVDVKCVVSIYATTSHSIDFIPTGTDEHVLIMLDNGDLMSAAVSNKKDVEALKEIRRASNKDGKISIAEGVKPVRIKGMVWSFEPQMEKAFTGCIEKYGLNDGQHNIYYFSELDCTLTWIKAVGLFAFAVIIEAFVICIIVDIIKKRRGI